MGPDRIHDAAFKALRDRSILPAAQSGPDGQSIVHVGPAGGALVQMGLDTGHFLRRKRSVHKRIQQGFK